jgi:hypothetical protein
MPLEFCRGGNPSHAAKLRPDRKIEGSGTLAAIAVAVIGPTPGMAAIRRLIGWFDAAPRCAPPPGQSDCRARREGITQRQA